MTRRRTFAALAGSTFAALLFCAATGVPAQAHGAPADPPSRAFACGPEGGQAGSTACKAAAAASGAKALDDWDNIRVANVNGRDRQLIPDGKLCSAGIAAYKGLDLPRTDWPATSLTAGAAITVRYRTTIPHKGSFRVYLTRDGYSASKPLTWADLDAKPFISVTDPTAQSGAYSLKGTLPTGRTGRHVIYTVWQNTSTPDTYYSCSDVVFPAAAAAAPRQSAAVPSAGQSGAGAVGSATPASATPADPAPSSSAAETVLNARPVSSTAGASRALPFAAGGALAMLVVAGAIGILLHRRRRQTPVTDSGTDW